MRRVRMKAGDEEGEEGEAEGSAGCACSAVDCY